MTISAELQARYTTEVDVDWRTALVFSHPSVTTQYVINHSDQYEGYVDGVIQLFQAVPIEIVPPNRDDSGRSDMSIILCGVQDEVYPFLYAALADATRPITCRYSVFILGNPYPQIDPWIEFQLTGISVTETTITATASRANILNAPFPNELYRIDNFPGLRRR